MYRLLILIFTTISLSTMYLYGDGRYPSEYHDSTIPFIENDWENELVPSLHAKCGEILRSRCEIYSNPNEYICRMKDISGNYNCNQHIDTIRLYIVRKTPEEIVCAIDFDVQRDTEDLVYQK